MEDGLQPCCADESNRTEPQKVDESREDIVVTKCSVCGRRHFEMTVDPVKLGLKFE